MGRKETRLPTVQSRSRGVNDAGKNAGHRSATSQQQDAATPEDPTSGPARTTPRERTRPQERTTRTDNEGKGTTARGKGERTKTDGGENAPPNHEGGAGLTPLPPPDATRSRSLNTTPLPHPRRVAINANDSNARDGNADDGNMGYGKRRGQTTPPTTSKRARAIGVAASTVGVAAAPALLPSVAR
ncbi:hypothetical protein GALMADRAFT_145527 [Galerina marginata CBS 339.88]|uniref:Uncharacterized protein n=1 Tax=Galerina marginata (strain CBS 339.88) TaxID=685588 RepID=A0A067SF32_GALM3|nr:hypothetical protein GALMADRAFT_145527 [Galerina marginata CBS 339.88]